MNSLPELRDWQKREMEKQLAALGKVADPSDLWPGDKGYVAPKLEE